MNPHQRKRHCGVNISEWALRVRKHGFASVPPPLMPTERIWE